MIGGEKKQSLNKKTLNDNVYFLGQQEEDLERCVTEADQGDRIVVSVSLPLTGEYGLEIYGNDPAKDGDTYTHVCQYFVHFAPPDEQANAFYQETPTRTRNMPDGKPMTKGYNPDTQQVGFIITSVYSKIVNDYVCRSEREEKWQFGMGDKFLYYIHFLSIYFAVGDAA